MRALSFVGQELFALVIIPLILWCLDPNLGIRLGLILLTSNTLKGILKIGFGSPRPYWISDRVRALAGETSYGLPSGHAQNAVAFWGTLATAVKSQWARFGLGLLIFLISISRLYLAVHFLGDVLIGWVVGGLLLALFVLLEPAFLRAWSRLGLASRIALCVAFSLALLGGGLAVTAATAGRPVPIEWIEEAAANLPGSPEIDPRSTDDLFSGAGAVLGISLGAVLLSASGGMQVGGSLGKRTLRYLVGLAGLLAIYFGLRIVFPDEPVVLGQFLRYVRYALVGLWLVYLAPKVFARLGLLGP
jgi:membrane-associated phospholipid phosphatase